jgi:predicted ATP-grasp superfamily ATP-dependent carboligase
VAGCGIRGLFGVDCVLKDGVPWPVEINPRYTASVEVIEHATGLVALERHRSVFEAEDFERVCPPSRRSEPVVGKAILYAPRDLVFPATGPWQSALAIRDPWRLPAFADIPASGTPIGQGQPVLTLLTGATTLSNCQAKLRDSAAELDRMLLG